MNGIAVPTDEDARRRRGPLQDSARVGDTAEYQPQHDRGPHADATFEQPEGRGQRCDDREYGRSTSSAAACFREDHRTEHRHGDSRPAERHDGEAEAGEQRERDGQPQRAGELVIGLSNALRPEVPGLRWQPADEQIERTQLPSTRSRDGSHQFQILEEHIAVIPAGGLEHVSTNAERARPVAASRPIDQHPSGIEAGVPGHRPEEVLGPDDVRPPESAEDGSERRLVVAHVVVSDDEQGTRGPTHPCQDASDLPIGEGHQVWIDRDVVHGSRPTRREIREDPRERSIDDDDLRHAVERRQPVEIGEQLIGHGRPRLERQNVSGRAHGATPATSVPPEPAPLGVAVGTQAPERERWTDAARRAVACFETPFYLNRTRPIQAALDQLERGDPGVRSWLSYKTHPLPRLLAWWVAGGRGVEVVSEREFTTARSLGCTPDQLLVNGPAKHAWLGRHPIPRLRVHFDSLAELRALLPLALSCNWRVGVRVHAPDERDARDPHFGGPFGLTAREAVDALRHLLDAGADVQSVHFHLGQAPAQPDAYVRAVEHAARICEAAAFRPRYLDLGGGLPAPSAAATAILGLWRGIDWARARFPELEQVWLENGRFVTDQAAALAVRVLDIKERPESRYLICDGGRTNQALAADRGLHPLLLVPERTGRRRLTTICGPTCMTDDTLGRLPLPEDIVPGDVLVWMNAGAYHLPWETRFSQGLCAIVWADEAEQLSLVRKPERSSDMGAP